MATSRDIPTHSTLPQEVLELKRKQKERRASVLSSDDVTEETILKTFVDLKKHEAFELAATNLLLEDHVVRKPLNVAEEKIRELGMRLSVLISNNCDQRTIDEAEKLHCEAIKVYEYQYLIYDRFWIRVVNSYNLVCMSNEHNFSILATDPYNR